MIFIYCRDIIISNSFSQSKKIKLKPYNSNITIDLPFKSKCQALVVCVVLALQLSRVLKGSTYVFRSESSSTNSTRLSLSLSSKSFSHIVDWYKCSDIVWNSLIMLDIDQDCQKVSYKVTYIKYCQISLKYC